MESSQNAEPWGQTSRTGKTDRKALRKAPHDDTDASVNPFTYSGTNSRTPDGLSAHSSSSHRLSVYRLSVYRLSVHRLS